MKIVLFTHPAFLRHQSMPRYARILAEGMAERGHQVAIWTPGPVFSRLPMPPGARKWLGYIDQFVCFPMTVRKQLAACPQDTLFVFTDQALSPWFRLVAGRPHVFHCHDFLAQRSALGEISEHPTGRTGRIYQGMIRQGFSGGRYFISVSRATQDDLHRALPGHPRLSEVVYNALDHAFRPADPAVARSEMERRTGMALSGGYLLHVGGNQWNKNRPGVVEIYNAWRSVTGRPLPLILVGEQPSRELSASLARSPYLQDIRLVSHAGDELVRMAYSGAEALLFPSLAEGFGWPVAEAMACGCPVITTGEAPMTEVAGPAGFYIPRRPASGPAAGTWAAHAAAVVERVVSLPGHQRWEAIRRGQLQAERFEGGKLLNRIESIYERVLSMEGLPETSELA